MFSSKVRSVIAGLCAIPVLLALTLTARADVEFSQGATVFDLPSNTVLLGGPQSFPGDYSVPDGAGVLLFHRFLDSSLTVNAGSTLEAGAFLSTFTDSGLTFKSEIFVDGPGSRVQIGTETGRTGNIVLRGFGDVAITNGAVVDWIDSNNCNADFLSCDILIGATGPSNTGIVVSGTGSALDASATSGRLFVGFSPSPVPGESDDFLVAENGGAVLSSGASVGKGFEGTGWTPSIGFVQGTAFIDNATWNVQAPVGSGLDSVINMGEGDGGTSNLFIVNGGVVTVTGNSGPEGGFYLGQTQDGIPTNGGSNLLGIRGTGSRLTVDNNSGVLSASRIANGFVTVQENGVLELDSSFLLVSGKTAQLLEAYNTTLALGPAGFSTVPSANLDVRTGGSITLTDNDAVGINALIIGQTPDAGPTQAANVEIASGGSITVINDASQPKIALGATAFGIPTVSNIGTGSLTIADGSLTVDNGDFVIGVELEDTAQVRVNAGGLLNADRVVVGWADFEAGGPGTNATVTGDFVLSDGAVNADVFVDDNGRLRGEGTINGTLFAEGGVIDPGFSPGTITAESFVLGPGSELIMELALNADGSINPTASDAVVATAGGIDLSGGTVTFELSSADPATTVDEIVAATEILVVVDVFDAPQEVVLADFELTDPSGSISDEELEQQVAVVSFDKTDCKEGGWRSLTRPDGTGFKNQGRCIRYVNTGQ